MGVTFVEILGPLSSLLRSALKLTALVNRNTKEYSHPCFILRHMPRSRTVTKPRHRRRQFLWMFFFPALSPFYPYENVQSFMHYTFYNVDLGYCLNFLPGCHIFCTCKTVSVYSVFRIVSEKSSF